jgi:CheY-like chemotaxis protein
MNDKFDFISATDKPALVASANPAWLDAAKKALQELGYKIHVAANHEDFLSRFSQVSYQIVLLEDFFNAAAIGENLSLKSLQKMLMSQRRHATIILVGNSVRTLDPMQAFQYSVHAVINNSEMLVLKQLVEKIMAENALFLHNFREVQAHIAKL